MLHVDDVNLQNINTIKKNKKCLLDTNKIGLDENGGKTWLKQQHFSFTLCTCLIKLITIHDTIATKYFENVADSDTDKQE
jgi:hypothetical protein